jgi:hypothetical protein
MIAVLHLDAITGNAVACIGPIEDSGNAANDDWQKMDGGGGS